MRIEVSHQLDLPDVIDQMQSLTAYWEKKYAVECRWIDTVSNLAGSFLGRTFQATLSVEQQKVALEGQIEQHTTFELSLNVSPGGCEITRIVAGIVSVSKQPTPMPRAQSSGARCTKQYLTP
jgi:hypothetical protein